MASDLDLDRLILATSNPRELVAKAEKMAAYYRHGFIYLISGIQQSMADYFEDTDLTEEDRTNVYREVEIIYDIVLRMDFYDRIPFDKLKQEEIFYPLFIVDRLLFTLKENVDNAAISKHPSWLDRINETATTIAVVGKLYRQSLEDTIEEIRKYKGYEQYKVEVKDFDGQTWHLPTE